MAAERMEVRRIEDAVLWDDFVNTSSEGAIFSTSGWVRMAARAQGGVPVTLGAFDDGRLVAGVAYVEISRGVLRKASSPALTPYCGFLFRPYRGKRRSEEESFRHAAAAPLVTYLSGRYGHVYLVHPPGVIDMRPFIWNGYAAVVRYTYILDISAPDRLWDVMEHRVRTVIRNAGGSLTVENSTSMDLFGALYEHVYLDRGNEPPVRRGTVVRMVGEVLETGTGEMRVVKDADGSALCAGVFVRDARTVYAWVSGAIPTRNPSGAMSLLFWDTADRYRATHGTLDMVGANLPSVAFFKKGFGGSLVPYFITERYSSPLTRAVFSLYSRIRKVLS